LESVGPNPRHDARGPSFYQTLRAAGPLRESPRKFSTNAI
jgi:hypothetical protein